jgi:hypothetical protein
MLESYIGVSLSSSEPNVVAIHTQDLAASQKLMRDIARANIKVVK